MRAGDGAAVNTFMPYARIAVVAPTRADEQSPREFDLIWCQDNDSSQFKGVFGRKFIIDDPA